MIRFLGCVGTFVLVLPLIAILYGAVFGHLYTGEQVIASFILFVLGCSLGAAVTLAWEDLK
jgi:hypothetical protein